MRGVEDVIAFHAQMNLPPFSDLMTKEEINKKRDDLIDEESSELKEAIKSGSKKEILHEGTDLMVIIYGAFVEAGITQVQAEAAWKEVQHANMTKGPPKHPRDKPTKPKGWRKANMARALKAKENTVNAMVAFTEGSNMQNAVIELTGGVTRASIEQARHDIAQSVGEDNITILSITLLSDSE